MVILLAFPKQGVLTWRILLHKVRLIQYIPNICICFCCVLLWFSTGQCYLYPSGLLHWHPHNFRIVRMAVKKPWRTWWDKSREPTHTVTSIKSCYHFLGHTVSSCHWKIITGLHVQYKVSQDKNTNKNNRYPTWSVARTAAATLLTISGVSSLRVNLNNKRRFTIAEWYKYIHVYIFQNQFNK